MSRASAQRKARVSGRRRQRGLVRGVLLFLAGLLAGANLLYFLWVRQPAAPAAPAPSATKGGDTVARTAPGPIASPHPPSVIGATPPPVTTGDAGGTTASAPLPTASAPGRPGEQGTSPGSLLIPVRGVPAHQLQDTFNDARSQGRSHEAIDIMAPAGTPVLAVADGTIEKLFTSVAGGLTVYQFEPSGRYAYYYAHLQGYAPGLAEKQALRRGDVIGYVGSTGNADPASPHLHFAVFELGPERRWWQGTAINPYPLLRRQ